MNEWTKVEDLKDCENDDMVFSWEITSKKGILVQTNIKHGNSRAVSTFQEIFHLIVEFISTFVLF